MTKANLDWIKCTLGELGVFSKGSGVTKAEVRESGFPCIRYGEIYTHHRTVVSAYNSFIDDATARTSKRIEYGDILLAGSGETKEEIGKATAFMFKDEAYAGGDIVIFRPRNSDSTFLAYLLNSQAVISQKASAGKGDAVVHISATDLGKIQINIPALGEQKAIAKALSDIDELIESFTIEIKKNENIKSGLIQRNLNSLTPNAKLRNHASLTSGGTPLTSVSDYYGGEIPWVSITDMTNSGKYIDRTVRNLSQDGLLNSSAVIYPKNTLLFAMYASIGKCALPAVPVSSSQAILGITVKPSLNIEYLYYILTSRTQDFISMGQQGTQSNLNKIIVGDFDIPLLPLKDQERIASEFINIDLKIESLKTELAKYECIKQGMAHDLLTGKVRLV